MIANRFPQLFLSIPFAALFLLDSHLSAAQEGESANREKFFQIQIVDKETRRGVPLVQLTTVSGIRQFSDSAGNIAFREPGLMNKEVFFHVESHGYQFPKDGFGFRGVRLKTTPGKKAVLEIERINIARRLYRITGQGIYQDTKSLGLDPPIELPRVSAQVVGCDSVVNAVYRDQLFWFWGDTNRFSYPLGNFQVSGARSANPSTIDASKGITLDYFENKNGFAKSMAPVPGKGPTWIFGAFVTRDKNGKERLVAKYEKIKPPMVAYQRGLVIFDDAQKQFVPLVQFPMESFVYPDGQAFVGGKQNKDYVYFATPFPLTRVKNDLQTIQDPNKYEAYTYFKSEAPEPSRKVEASRSKEQGDELEFDNKSIDRDKNGRLVCKWRKNAQPISPKIEQKLIKRGLIKPEEALTVIRPTGKQIQGLVADEIKTSQRDVILSSGSVAWNRFRKKWILIGVQVWGTSMLGEIWYAESERLEGPWQNPTKIVTHNDYSFYNPRHHPYFDQLGGRIIYLEGTYTKMFSGTKVATPKYDYNQIMYQLDLSDIVKRISNSKN